MTYNSKKAIEEFLNKCFDDQLNISDVYDSDSVTEYRPGNNNNTNINSAGPSRSFLPSVYSSDDESFSEY